ncbi:MAG TPA: Ldh family oxidoreductase [Acidobacteriota bacterium]|jgi:LDH2 family malate/lactate/ureidoglycolate dehydrogenase
MPDTRIPVTQLTEFCTRCFQKLGLGPDDARLTGSAIVAANLRGVDSHGIIRMKIYTDRLRAGGIKPDGEFRVVREGAAFALVDGGSGMGQIISARAMRLAIEKGLAAGVSIVGVRNSNHFGAAAFYALMAVEQGMIGFAGSNAGPTMAPSGGSRKILGNNPLCVAIPAGAHRPVVLDMATGAVALGKILVAMTEGRRIPPTWGFDSHWLATDNPRAVIDGGSIQPLGGYKGYGLSMILDLLTGVLTGSAFAASVSGLYGPMSEPQGIGHMFGTIRVESFMPLGEFKSRVDEEVSSLKNCPRAPGTERVFVPGEIEDEIEIERRANGIPVNDVLKRELSALASELDVLSPFC